MSLVEAGRYTLVPEDVRTNVPLLVGNFCSIASGLTVVSGHHPGVGRPKLVSDFPFADHDGFGAYPASDMGVGIWVGHDVWIGQGVTLIDPVQIGHGARIGAGAVVAADVPPYCVAVGNPAQFRSRFEPHRVEALLRIEWWRWDDRKIAAALGHFADVDTFIAMYDNQSKETG